MYVLKYVVMCYAIAFDSLFFAAGLMMHQKFSVFHVIIFFSLFLGGFFSLFFFSSLPFSCIFSLSDADANE